MVRRKTRLDRTSGRRRGPLFWTAAFVVAAVIVGLTAYEVVGTITPKADDRIWISDPHRDFHGFAPAPRR
ncbi:MAG: hypothetical protein ACI9LT_002039 [Pseudoalteromonas distincta]